MASANDSATRSASSSVIWVPMRDSASPAFGPRVVLQASLVMAILFSAQTARSQTSDLSHLDPETRQSIELACVMEKTRGPAPYTACINRQLASIRGTRGIPDLSNLDRQTRQSIELACVMEKSEGPARYAACISRHLASIEGGEADHESSADLMAPQQAKEPDSLIEEAPLGGDGGYGYRSRNALPAWEGPGVVIPDTLTTEQMSPARLFRVVERSVYVVITSSGDGTSELSDVTQGSGVAVSTQKILTNCHVLANANAIAVLKADELIEAYIDSADITTDRCVLRIASGALSPIAGLRSFSELSVGEKVYAIGSPRGLENSLSEGLISGLREDEGTRYIQTSAAISPGSSGGGLFDEYGNLIGITTMLLRESQNLNFAISADDFWN